VEKVVGERKKGGLIVGASSGSSDGGEGGKKVEDLRVLLLASKADSQLTNYMAC
jgi:hypothetical protein